MASSPSPGEGLKFTILSLPDDILVKIFNQLCPTLKYTLQTSVDAANLALTNTRLRRIFSSQLTHITPITQNYDAETLSSKHYETLIRIAGDNLRELRIPYCRYDVIHRIPELCPNVEVFSFFCGDPGVVAESDSGDSVSEDPESSDGEDDGDDSEDDDIDIEGGDIEQGDNRADEDQADDTEGSVQGASVNDDGTHPVEDASNEEDKTRCRVLPILSRLKLRAISVYRPPHKFIDTVLPLVASQTLQELQIHQIRRDQLRFLIPLFSHPLKSLTITTHHYTRISSLSKLLDALIEAVPHIPSVTVQSPRRGRLETLMECSVNLGSLDFPAEATSMIRAVRENNGTSKCKSINLAGESTFRLLSAVDRNASITLSVDKITVCDHGEGTRLTSLPLYDEFLDEDVTHLENAYILQRWYHGMNGLVEYEWNDEWARRLAGRRLRVVRTFDANIFSRLELSTESLELFCKAIPNVTNWTFLNGVRELYLLGPPSNYGDNEETEIIDPVIKLLPQLVDAFQGELICTGLYCVRHRMMYCESTEAVIQFVNETKDAIKRFVRRGGDAATLSAYLETLLRNLSEGLEGEDMMGDG